MFNLTPNEIGAVGVLVFVLVVATLILWGSYGVSKLKKALRDWNPPER